MTNPTRTIRRVFYLLAVAGMFAATTQGAEVKSASDDSTSRGAKNSDPGLAALCTSCHGPQGDSLGPATPTIGGLARNNIIGAMLAYKFSQDLDQADALIESDPDIEDVLVLERPPGVMNAIAEMLSIDEIKEIADHLSKQAPGSAKQETDATLAAAGADLHERYCEKCHEDGGTSTLDDVGLLAGRWKLYLTYLFEDLSAGRREMPKKMADKFNALLEDHGDAGFRQLIDYYAAQNVAGGGS